MTKNNNYLIKSLSYWSEKVKDNQYGIGNVDTDFDITDEWLSQFEVSKETVEKFMKGDA